MLISNPNTVWDQYVTDPVCTETDGPEPQGQRSSFLTQGPLGDGGRVTEIPYGVLWPGPTLLPGGVC